MKHITYLITLVIVGGLPAFAQGDGAAKNPPISKGDLRLTLEHDAVGGALSAGDGNQLLP